MKLKNFWPALLWAFFVLVICDMNLGKAGESHLFFKGFDKLTHTGLFFVLTILVSYGLIKKNGKMNPGTAIVVCIVGVAFGGLIEILQYYIFTWRSAEWADLFCDTVGLSMALFAVFTLQNAIKRNET